MKTTVLLTACTFAGCLLSGALLSAEEPAWTRAHRQGPMSAEETREFARRLTLYVRDNHLKQGDSPQRGMIYEYFDVQRKGQFDQFVQGEALDTMHDGAWFAAAMVSAYRATEEPLYKEILTRWQLPFYLKMLNHSDTLFTGKRNDARPGVEAWGKEWALQEGEKGFVPYYWDDGGSVSLERRREKNPLAIRPSVDLLAGKENPRFLLDGYSQGSSNHLAQDLGVLLQQAWLLLKDSNNPGDQQLAAEVALGAKNLDACRRRHHGMIPMCLAPLALASGEEQLLKQLPDLSGPSTWQPAGAYVQALYEYKPGQRISLPGFADDQQYRYYHGLARHGSPLPRPLAFQIVYGAMTAPILYDLYCDDAETPAGINRFDLHPYYFVDGKPTDYRSDRKGPSGKPRPSGSRMGPQNMICSGWALQALKTYPGIWEERPKTQFPQDLRVYFEAAPPGVRLEPVSMTPVALGDVTLSLKSTRSALMIRGQAKRAPIAFTVFAQADSKGSSAVVTARADGTVSAVNDRGEALLVEGTAKGAADALTFELELPYTVAKGQKAWANGIEHGRYSLASGEARRNFYLASEESLVRMWLEHDLGRGLRTWDALFREFGFIPTGIDAGGDWHRYSDSGGYAHLTSAAAQWLLYLDNKSDWELQSQARSR